jgi:hypothetical protein
MVQEVICPVRIILGVLLTDVDFFVDWPSLENGCCRLLLCPFVFPYFLTAEKS